MRKLDKKKIFLKVMRIVSIFSKLFSLIAVRLDLAELRWKNRKKMSNL